MTVTLLPVGGTPHYELGLLSGLVNAGVKVDVIGNDLVSQHELSRHNNVNILNLREDQNPDSPLITKSLRILRFYFRLIWYALTTRSRIFHIQWENKFILFDRTVLILIYKLLGKKLVYTAHNVNGEARDDRDSLLNRFSLKVLYSVVDHIIVHTGKMKSELQEDYGVSDEKVSVIPMGLIKTFKKFNMDKLAAREFLGISPNAKVLLFFGAIDKYKGLDILVDSLAELLQSDSAYFVIVAGRPKGTYDFEEVIQPKIKLRDLDEHLLRRLEFIPEEEIETYFMAADCLVLPYKTIYQSAVFFLAYSFGLPILASDVGSFRENLIEGRTGMLFTPHSVDALTRKIELYFASDLYKNLDQTRDIIKRWAEKKYSWQKAGMLTANVYKKFS